jgi:RHS repeat-associated protein
MVGLNVLPLLNVSASPYRNWLLTALPPNALLQNYYLSSQTFSEGTSENYLNDLCQCNETDFIKVIASNPRFAYVFLRGLCVYDGENSTNYASGAQNMLFGSTICPGDQSLLDQLDITLAGNLQGASTKIGQLETYLNSNFSGQCAVITQVLQYAYNHIVETEDNDALTDFYNLIASVPSYNTTAIIDNHCECGSFDLDALVQEQSLFISFLQALKIRDNSTYNSFCNNLSISNVLDQLANDLSTKSTTDIVTELNNVGIESCNTMFNDIMHTLRLINQSDFDGIISHSGIAPDIELSCIANHQANSCTGQSSPINTLITQYYSQSQLWNTLLQIEDASHYTQWYYTNSLQSYLPLAAANTITQISTYQQSNNTMYGSNYSQAMANYMQYIHQHFGNTVYNQLTGHYLNVSRMFDDSIKATEFAMYGSSRLGVMRTNIVMAAARFNNPDGTQTFTNTNTTVAAYTNTVAFSRGQKQFELTNHLGNVMAVVTDKKLPDVTYLNNFDAHIDLWNGGWSGAGTGITPATTVSFNHIEVSGNDIRQAKIVTSQNGGGGLKEIQTTIGTTYKFSFSAKLGTATSLTAKAKAKDGTTLYNGTTLTSLSITADGNYIITFTATTTTTQLVLEKVGGQGTSQEFYLDNALVFAAPNGITAPQRFYRAEVLHATDYSPFGAPMPSRSYSYNKRDAVIVGQLAGNMSTTGWQTTYCTAPSSCSTPESSVTLSTTTEGKLRMEATKRYSQMYYTFTTVPGRVYRVKYKLSNSTMGMVNTSLFAPVALKELYTTANITTFDFEREMIFTATETTTRFYVTKGWSALATTALQQIELDYLIVVEMPSQINYISCTSINQNLTMLANAGVNINDSVQVRNYLNSYYNRNNSYAAYSQVLSGCANQTLNYVLALPGVEAEEAKDGYRFGFNGKENDNDTYGEGNAYDFGARIYDSRLGRWLATDPLESKYPSISTYASFGNNPIFLIDPDGRWINWFASKGVWQARRALLSTKTGRAVWKELRQSRGEVILKLRNDVLIDDQFLIQEGITHHPSGSLVVKPQNAPAYMEKSTIYVSLAVIEIKTNASSRTGIDWNDMTDEQRNQEIQIELATGKYQVTNVNDLINNNITGGVEPSQYVNIGVNPANPNTEKPIKNEKKKNFLNRVLTHEGSHPKSNAKLARGAPNNTGTADDLDKVPANKKERDPNTMERETIKEQKKE